MIKRVFATIILSTLILGITGIFGNVYAAATLYLSASSTTVYVGNTFSVYPRVNTGGAATNSYGVYMTFPGNITPISASTGGSVCTLYTQQPSYSAGTANISCGLPSPGYNGSSGGLGSFTFRATSKGTATIVITSASQVLANDGNGTNILGTRGSLTINITDPPPPPVDAPTVTSSLGKQEGWYSSKSVIFSWNTPAKAKGFSYILTTDQNNTVPKKSLGSDTSKEYSNLADGKYYFKIIATDGSQWSNPTTFTLNIDTTSPTDIEIIPEPNSEQIDVLPFISFNAIDKTSGIDYYMIKIDDGEFIKTENPYQIEEIGSGEHTITVRAYDKAGNYAEESTKINIKEIEAPTIRIPKRGAYIPIKDYLYIEGSALPNSLVNIYLNGEFLAQVTADGNGKFTYTHNQLLEAGKYELYAVLQNMGGIYSSKSELVDFTIDPYGIKLFGQNIPSFLIVVLLICIFFWFVLLLIFLYKKYRDYKNNVKSKNQDTEKLIDHELDDLERTIRRDIQETLSEGSQKISKKTEHKLERKVSDEIQEVEKNIEEKIGNSKPMKKKKVSKVK